MKIIPLIFIFIFSNAFAKTNETKYSITTSGGVSLGAYQAGFSYFLANYISSSKNKELLPNVVTGTSAGSINSLFFILESCGKENVNPRDSVYWKFWDGIGLDTIYQPKKMTNNSIFYRPNTISSMQAMKAKWLEGIKVGCTFHLGVTFTHLIERNIKINDELKVPHMKETIVLKIEGRGLGIAPKITVENIKEDQNFFIEFKGNELEQYYLLENILYASSAFPIAFAPVPIKFCYVKKNENSCNGKQVNEDFFVDGGILNNTPLRLSKNIQLNLKNSDLKYLIIDSDPHILNLKNENKKANLNNINLIDVSSSLFLRFMSVSQNSDLNTFISETASDQYKVYGAVTQLPLAGEPLFHFFGFFENDFRKYDFYLGMNDARIFIEDQLHEKLDGTIQNFDLESKQKMNCLRDFNLCDQVKDHNFLVLLQSSIYKVHDMCLAKKENTVKALSKICNEALNSKNDQAPNIILEKIQNWNQSSEENDLDYTIRLLTAQKFQFKYLKNSDDPSEILHQIKEILRSMTKELVSQQKEGHSPIFDFVEKNVLDFLYYEPAKNYWFINFGKLIEVGYRFNPTTSTQLKRINISLSTMLQSNYVNFNRANQEVATSFLGGVYFQIPYFESKAYQLSLSSKYGYQFSSGDRLGRDKCSFGNASVISCSTEVYQLGLGITFYDRFGFSYVINHYKDRRNDNYIPDNTLLLTINLNI